MRDIFEEILNSEDITIDRCRELAKMGITAIEKYTTELGQIEREIEMTSFENERRSKHEFMLIEAKRINGEFDNRFKFARDILDLIDNTGWTISSLVFAYSDGDDFFGGVWDLPYLSDRQCQKLSELTRFSYRYIRSEFSNSDFSFQIKKEDK